MREPPKNVPVWLCHIRGDGTRFVAAARPGGAEAECRSAGLGTPSALHYAGYSAAPAGEPAYSPAKPRRRISSRRAEMALTIYGLLRVDWPIGSILNPAKAAARLPSQSALRDFLADVGMAIERIKTDHRILDRVIQAQGLTWYHANREKNSRLVGDWTAADRHQQKKELNRETANRLRKRRAYQLAIGELMASLDGALPKCVSAAESFSAFLIEHGMAPDDVQSITRRLRRVAVPNL